MKNIIKAVIEIDNVVVEKGDQILFITAGSGGWGDPLDREPEKVQLDVARGLVSKNKALLSYGVYLDDNLEIDAVETENVRTRMREERGTLESFNFGKREKAHV